MEESPLGDWTCIILLFHIQSVLTKQASKYQAGNMHEQVSTSAIAIYGRIPTGGLETIKAHHASLPPTSPYF